MILANKKIAIVLIGTSILFAGCSAKEVDAPNASQGDVVVTESSVVGGTDQLIMEEFDTMVKGSTTTDIISFIDANIEKVGQENADKMIMSLEEVLLYDLDDYNMRLFEEGTQEKIVEVFGAASFDNARISEIKNDELKAVLAEMISNGIKIETSEGMHYAVIDYPFFKQYEQYLSDAMGQYTTFMANRSEHPMFEEGEIVISTDALVQRILEAEALLKTELPLDYKYQVGMYYTDDMVGLMKGSYYNPLFDHETGALNNQELLTVLKETAESHKDTNMGQVLTEYLAMIEAGGNAMTDELSSAPFDLVDESLTQFFQE